MACLTGPTAPLHQILDQLLEFRARQLLDQMFRAGLIGRDERQVDVGLHHGRQLHLGLLRRLLQALQRHPVLTQVDAFVALELRHDPVNDPLIEVVAAKMGVPVGRLDLDDSFADLQDRDVERATAKVEYGDRFIRLLVEAIRQRRACRFIHDPEHLQTGNLACVLRRLTLRVVEIRRHGDHRLAHRLTEVRLRRLAKLLQDHRGDLRRRVRLVTARRLHPGVAVRSLDDRERHHLHLLAHFVDLPAHEALDREHGVLGIRHGLPFGDLADETLTPFRKADDGRRQSAALWVGDDHGLAAFHHGNDGIRGPEIDSDDFAHVAHLRTVSVSCVRRAREESICNASLTIKYEC